MLLIRSKTAIQTDNAYTMHGEATARCENGAWDYLFLSDVHLGSDLVPHLRPWARDSWLAEAPEIDAQLVSFLEHYQTHPRPLCLVAAGDFLELVGVSLSAHSALRTQPTQEELRHGLGSASDHVVAKIEAIATRHTRVFRAFCAFIARGNRLVLVRGNHDVELHWRAAQNAFIRAVSRHAENPLAAREVASRIEICPWFFHVPGLLYVEHGNEFDAMCSYGEPLLPTCPRDSRRIRVSPFSVMLREVARPTRGLSSSCYENVALSAYLGLLVNLGVRGSARIVVRFARAARRLLRESMEVVDAEKPLRQLHKTAREQRFVRKARTSQEQLARLRTLYAPPAARDLRFMLRSLYLDRMIAALTSLCFVVLGATLARYETLLSGVLAALPALPLGAYGWLGPSRDLSPRPRMRKAADEIARMFGVRYVVMGHTHEAEDEPLTGDARYLNLGHWGSDDIPEEAHPPEPNKLRTFVLLARSEHGYHHELLRWDAVAGVRTHVLPSGTVPQPQAPLGDARTA